MQYSFAMLLAVFAVGLPVLGGVWAFARRRASSGSLPRAESAGRGSGPNRRALSADGIPPDLQELKHGLSRFQFEAGLERIGERAVLQLKEVLSRYDFFRSVLEEKMDPSELTFGRYDSAARSVRLAVIENLRRIEETLNPSKRGTAAGGNPAPTADADGLLALNDQALLRLDAVTTSLRGIRTARSGESEDLALLMGELEDLAGRAKKYST